MKLIDALNRIERAGLETSRANQKLIEAAEIVGGKIFDTLTKSELSPDQIIYIGEGVLRFSPAEPCRNTNAAAYGARLYIGETWWFGECDKPHYERRQVHTISRSQALEFARVIANGGLTEIEDQIKAFMVENVGAAAEINRPDA